MSGIISAIIIFLFILPASLVIDHIIDYRRALQKHRMFPDVYPNPKKKRPRKLTEEEKLAIEKSRKAAEEAANWVAERNKKIRDLFYEDYVSEGDFVKIKHRYLTYEYSSHDPNLPMGYEEPGVYCVVQTGTYTKRDDTKNIYGHVENSYEKRNYYALCEQVLDERGNTIPVSDREQTRKIVSFYKLIKCYQTGEVIYDDMYEWGKEQREKIREAGGFYDIHTENPYRTFKEELKDILGIPIAYAKYTEIRPAHGIWSL